MRWAAGFALVAGVSVAVASVPVLGITTVVGVSRPWVVSAVMVFAGVVFLIAGVALAVLDGARFHLGPDALEKAKRGEE